jgi:PhnB protein
MTKVNPIPQGLHSLTPVLTIKGAGEAIELYQQAFGAEVIDKAMDPSGKFVWHAMLRIGDSMLMLNDEIPGMTNPATPTSLYLYRDNIDELFARVQKLGFKVTMPMSDMFWGDRFGKVVDRFGNDWGLAQKIRDMTKEELARAAADFSAQMAKQGGPQP